MAQHAKVPEFGNWDSNENVPYTQYFEKTRKDRSTWKMINPNDPQENPKAFQADAPSSDAADSDVTRPKEVVRASSRDEEFGPSQSPLRHDPASRRTTMDSPFHRHGYRSSPGEQPRKASRAAAGGGFDSNVNHSPFHSSYEAKYANKGMSSPSKSSSESSYALSNRLRTKAGGRGDETPERGSAVPKFGEWDESNPSTADGYTHIFNKVREEKQTGSAKVAMISDDTIYVPGQDSKNTNLGCGCFNWCRK